MSNIPPATDANAWMAYTQQLQNMWQGFWQPLSQLPAGLPVVPGLPQVGFDADKLQALHKDYLAQIADLWQQQGAIPASIASDKRFAAQEWQAQPMAGFAAALHLIHTRMWMGLVDAMQCDAKTRARARFAVEQWAAASAPSNFLAFNPEAQRKALDTQGESLARGMQNLFEDIRKGHVSMTDESQFEVGRNMATTEGAVIFENDLFQLIEYKPLTDKVYERPFLFVPPCINKYYILDLQPDNSMVRYVIEQGYHTFMVSWRNPDAAMAHVTWDDYVEQGALVAIAKVQERTGAPQINALGFCVGGTILACTLAVLAARGLSPIHSATLLTTLLDFAHSGVLDVFIDEPFVQMREAQYAKGGVMPASELATTFSFLRPTDLVWNYVVGNYLKGETPPPFDLLYWNCDSTNLPGPMYAWYLRNTYLENRLSQPAAATVCGVSVDLGRIQMPLYIYGSREDHIVPIDGSYASAQALAGASRRFVMGASGHIAGVINPAKKNRRSYWTNDALPETHAQWLQGAQEHQGSWWNDWAQWLAAQGGKQKAAPKACGNAHFAVIEAAPGRYVRAKA